MAKYSKYMGHMAKKYVPLTFSHAYYQMMKHSLCHPKQGFIEFWQGISISELLLSYSLAQVKWYSGDVIKKYYTGAPVLKTMKYYRTVS